MSARHPTHAAWATVLLLLLAACAPFGACGQVAPSAPGDAIKRSATAPLVFFPSSVDFGDQIRGSGSSGLSVVVHITNPPTGRSVVLGTFSMQPTGWVTISKDTCSNRTLAPGATCSVELSYPEADAPLGRFAGTLILPDDIPPDMEAKLSLKGNLEQM